MISTSSPGSIQEWPLESIPKRLETAFLWEQPFDSPASLCNNEVKLGVVLIGLVIFGYAEVWGEDWSYYGDNEMHLSYYDAQSITRPSKNIVRVWVKSVFTEKGVMDWVGRGGKKMRI